VQLARTGECLDCLEDGLSVVVDPESLILRKRFMGALIYFGGPASGEVDLVLDRLVLPSVLPGLDPAILGQLVDKDLFDVADRLK